jgi:O-antigen/teichoic acid export membrane protein
LRNAFSFGANATGSNILDFAAGNLDNVIIGVMLGVPTLGQYVMAYQFIRAPGLALSRAADLFDLSDLDALCA